MPSKVYLAYPMRGVEHFNAPAADAAAMDMRLCGHYVFNPLDRDRSVGFDPYKDTLEGFDIAAAMRADLAWITAEADCVVVLPGWENSEGAKLEVAVARACGIPVYDKATTEEIQPSVATEVAP